MRFVIKVGTYLVMKEDHTLNEAFLKDLTAQIASLVAEGHEAVLVSSGAVAAGRGELHFDGAPKNIPYRQALAAVGQSVLMENYRAFFGEYKLHVAQALLTNYDFTNKENFFNTRNVFEQLLQRGIVPIVNENDVTTIAELKFGDNDTLAAKTAAMISADLVVLLTNVKGLYTAHPEKDPNARFIDLVEAFDDSIFSVAEKATKPGTMGGMYSKVRAAEYAVSSGITACIGNGHTSGIVRRIADFFLAYRTHGRPAGDFPATFFPAHKETAPSFKSWMKPQIVKDARIIVDDGCRDALVTKGKSLLSTGIREVQGSFARGDIVELVDCAGKRIGYGQTHYGAQEIEKIKGKKSAEIEETLGYTYEDEVMHRDRMVVE